MEEKKETQLKKCTNCSRAPQLIENFKDGDKEFSTCLKCRQKGKKFDSKPERRQYHNELNKEKCYSEKWRKKQLEERPEEFREHKNETHRQWRKENAEHSSMWYRTSVNSRLDALKRSAEQRNIPWELSDEDAKSFLIQPCIYCEHIDLTVRVNGIDRLDSAKGYTLENCKPCCKDCNYMKGCYDPKTFIEKCKKVSQCNYEFPDVPTCTNHKQTHRRAVLSRT